MAYFVVHTRSGGELLAAAMLEMHLGLAVYLPQVDQRRRGRMALAPLFPGYLFVESAAQEFVRSAVDAQPGVIRSQPVTGFHVTSVHSIVLLLTSPPRTGVRSPR